MLTAHECIRALAELRAARPRVTNTCRWPHVPAEVDIETPRLKIYLNRTAPGPWHGWAGRPGTIFPEFGCGRPWPESVSGRFFDELDGLLDRAGIEGRVDRVDFGEMPF